MIPGDVVVVGAERVRPVVLVGHHRAAAMSAAKLGGGALAEASSDPMDRVAQPAASSSIDSWPSPLVSSFLMICSALASESGGCRGVGRQRMAFSSSREITPSPLASNRAKALRKSSLLGMAPAARRELRAANVGRN